MLIFLKDNNITVVTSQGFFLLLTINRNLKKEFWSCDYLSPCVHIILFCVLYWKCRVRKQIQLQKTCLLIPIKKIILVTSIYYKNFLDFNYESPTLIIWFINEIYFYSKDISFVALDMSKLSNFHLNDLKFRDFNIVDEKSFVIVIIT